MDDWEYGENNKDDKKLSSISYSNRSLTKEKEKEIIKEVIKEKSRHSP